jgi:hypothetical protein
MFSHFCLLAQGGAMSAQHFLRVDRSTIGTLPVFNRDAAALARARRARSAFQDRLTDAFGAHLRGAGAEPSDSDLRTFALLVAAEHQLEGRLIATSEYPSENGATLSANIRSGIES